MHVDVCESGSTIMRSQTSQEVQYILLLEVPCLVMLVVLTLHTVLSFIVVSNWMSLAGLSNYLFKLLMYFIYKDYKMRVQEMF